MEAAGDRADGRAVPSIRAASECRCHVSLGFRPNWMPRELLSLLGPILDEIAVEFGKPGKDSERDPAHRAGWYRPGAPEGI